MADTFIPCSPVIEFSAFVAKVVGNVSATDFSATIPDFLDSGTIRDQHVGHEQVFLPFAASVRPDNVAFGNGCPIVGIDCPSVRIGLIGMVKDKWFAFERRNRFWPEYLAIRAPYVYQSIRSCRQRRLVWPINVFACPGDRNILAQQEAFRCETLFLTQMLRCIESHGSSAKITSNQH